MIDKLKYLLPDFPGQASRTRCFAHIVNLVAKTAIRQFDVPEGKAARVLNDAERELRALAQGIDLEDQEIRGELDLDDDDPGDDDEEGWVDEREEMDEEELDELEASVRPMRAVLTKVS